VHIVLQPAERRRMLFVLGHGSDTADRRAAHRTPCEHGGGACRARQGGDVVEYDARRDAPLCRGTGLYKTEPCVMAADVYVSARTRAASWPEYSIQWTFLDTRYDITVSNPTGRSRGVGMRCWTAPRPMQQRFR
jgi:hypothetical protein